MIPSADRLADGLTDDVVALPSPVRVLLVEDDRDYAESLKDLLEIDPTTRFAVTHVATLAEAVGHIRDDVVDAVVLDLSLPRRRRSFDRATGAAVCTVAADCRVQRTR